jgi:hypothetical protein
MATIGNFWLKTFHYWKQMPTIGKFWRGLLEKWLIVDILMPQKNGYYWKYLREKFLILETNG